jgi:urea transport system permease protein
VNTGKVPFRVGAETQTRYGIKITMSLVQCFSRINGPQTLGRGLGFWVPFVFVLLIAFAFPMFSDDYTTGNVAYFFTWLFMAAGLCLMWGYGGTLSFGQTAFFGIGGYTYGVLTINFGADNGMTLYALAASIIFGAIIAALLGYFLFYGRINGVFLGIVTLAVSILLERFMAQTAGPQWHIGEARLNGFNGMNGMPALTIPWPGGDIVLLAGLGFYYVVLGLLLVVYFGIRILVNSRFGNVLVAIRENPLRVEMLGYDVRKFQLGAFVIGSALASLSGVLYTCWGQYITPSSMSLTSAALPIVWVAIGGRSDITASLVGALLTLMVFQTLTVNGAQYALIIMGVLLLVNVLTAPEGLVLQLFRVRFKIRGRN